MLAYPQVEIEREIYMYFYDAVHLEDKKSRCAQAPQEYIWIKTDRPEICIVTDRPVMEQFSTQRLGYTEIQIINK